MATYTVRLIQVLWRGHPSFADEWPWLIGPLAVAVVAFVVAQLLVGRDPKAAATTDLGPPAGDPSMDLARRLVRQRKRIQAVKMIRQLTGVSLEEAVAVVEAMEKEASPE